MLKKDLVIGIVGATILVAAMVGVFRYEAARAGGSAFEVDWVSETLAGPSVTGSTDEGDQSDVAVQIDQANLTEVRFVLSWTDETANSDPDEFELVVISPDGVQRNATASSGSVAVVFEDLAVQPAPQTVLAGSETEARGKLEGQESHVGTGEWQIVVRMIDAGDVPVVGGVVPQDPGNAWTLETSLRAYSARLAPP